MKTTVLREQLQQYGPQSLSTEELLALIFSTESTSERVQMLKKMQKLFTVCGDLQGVLCAEFGEICLAHGFGEQKTAQLQAVLKFAKRLASHSPEKKYKIHHFDNAASLVRMGMMYLDHEQMRVLVLNTQREVIANLCLYEGTVDSTVVRTAEVFRPAITRKAPTVVVCHNHPSGNPCPSPQDLHFTRQLVTAGQALDIEVFDHLIIGNPDYVSLKERMSW
jgi:DNA repair protein RadC